MSATDQTLYADGLYTIEIVNNIGQDVDIELTVFLVDDDGNLNNVFPYAYKVRYKNYTHSEAFDYIVNPKIQDGIWKSAASFVIPYAGDGTEISSYK